MIEASDLFFEPEGKTVLNGVSVKLKRGKIYGFVGRSGEGKSSLFRCLTGHESVTSGNIVINQIQQPFAYHLLIPGFKNTSLVHQDFQLLGFQTVEDNLRERMVHLPRKNQDRFITELLDLVELEENRNQKVDSLSGGEQQRLALIRALADENDYLFLDEPFVHMHLHMRSRLIAYLEQLREIRNTCICIISHNGEEIMGFTDEVFFVKKGRIIRKGKPLDFYYHPKTLEQGLFFGPLNAIELKGEKVLFRPDEYSLQRGEIEISVSFEKGTWQGMYYLNEFLTDKGEKVVLISHRILKECSAFYLDKRQ
ncbi:MAG: ABC transporter ATP-binding protein [Crocinitomicaceae bacterium]|nr:ABC transporter ATP-binding protein [Crocinitomicaceae bacterium]